MIKKKNILAAHQGNVYPHSCEANRTASHKGQEEESMCDI